VPAPAGEHDLSRQLDLETARAGVTRDLTVAAVAMAGFEAGLRAVRCIAANHRPVRAAFLPALELVAEMHFERNLADAALSALSFHLAIRLSKRL
jgi:hypothetical protein